METQFCPKVSQGFNFQAVIVSKLLYGLSSSWLNAAKRRRLDGFQARCLRKIFNMKHPYLSRVSNDEVLKRAGAIAFTKQLLKQQLKLFAKVAALSDSHFLRELTFCPSTLRAATDRYVRRVGRPRSEWATKMYSEALRVANQTPAMSLEQLLNNKLEFERRINLYINT